MFFVKISACMSNEQIGLRTVFWGFIPSCAGIIAYTISRILIKQPGFNALEFVRILFFQQPEPRYNGT